MTGNHERGSALLSSSSRVVPTLELMAAIYRLSRAGGPRSPRFTEYVKHAEHVFGLSGYNPMAGDAAHDAVTHLMEIGAERLAEEAMHDVVGRLGHADAITLALVVASTGMWTDRLATEVAHRTALERSAHRGTVLLWTRESIERDDVLREAAAETVRIAWTARHGDAASVVTMLAREGLAYAPSLNQWAPTPPDTSAGMNDVLAVLGDSRTLGDIVAVLYGDDAASELGHPPAGLPARTGFAWAAARADEFIAQRGAATALADFRPA